MTPAPFPGSPSPDIRPLSPPMANTCEIYCRRHEDGGPCQTGTGLANSLTKHTEDPWPPGPSRSHTTSKMH